jgi:TonB family protein
MMPVAATLGNLAAWGLQSACIAAAAAVLIRLVPLHAAGIRYGYWRVALVLCFAAPWLGGLAPAPVPAPAAAIAAINVVQDAERASAAPAEAPPAATPSVWSPSIALWILALGIAIRALWIGVGLLRLRQFRRRGELAADAELDAVQQALGTRAAVRFVTGLTQPVTFGVIRPVVLLPASLSDAPVATLRAVMTHELFHVQRCDWGWVIAEEALRTIFWFNPAVWWLTSRVQAAREEFVDHLTVLATGSRRTYIEALLAFANAAPVRPAAAFARRPHLFTRIVRLSQETAMSSSRIVLSGTVILVALVTAGWYASDTFPLLAAPAPAPTMVAGVAAGAEPNNTTAVLEPRRQAQMAEARGAGASRPGPAVATPQQALPTPAPRQRPGATAPVRQVTPENPIPRRVFATPVAYPLDLQGSGYRGAVELLVVLDERGYVSSVSRGASGVSTPQPGVTTDQNRAMASFVSAAIEAVERWQYDAPFQAPLGFYVALTFRPGEDALVSQSDAGRGVSTRGSDVRIGVDAEAVRLMEAAATARASIQRQPPDSVPVLTSPSGATPVRVGGAVLAPSQIRKINPVYPEIARTARVQGVVIVELLIDEQGHVSSARVLRSIPLLDQAALDAVKQWEYTPTLLNGAPVPVIMTATVQFTLAQ